MEDRDVDHYYRHHGDRRCCRNNRCHIVDNNEHNENNIYNKNRYGTTEKKQPVQYT